MAKDLSNDLVGVSPEIVERVREWQPFNTPDGELAWGKFLGELSNYDKHRTVTHTAALVSAHNTIVQIPVGQGELRRVFSDMNTDDSGAVTSDLPWAIRVRVEHDDGIGAVDVGVLPFVSTASATFDVQFSFKQNHRWRFGIGTEAPRV
ncbi:hypothetical protein [Gordonia amicalis]|uniref:hypothetical protein n=1 Tax=Gordonia amicalis TaxID=89053 RepID=UPI0015F6A298|nr:hypothetical protein [Gordonia amicalis]MBA5846170.1 hypothetical protein [Gordonia amicalis]